MITPFLCTPSQRAALVAACEAMIPSISEADGLLQSTGADFDVAGQIIEVMADQSITEQKEFRQLLSLLDSGWSGLFFAGKWSKFAQLPLESRIKVLQNWRDSRFNELRKAFATLKKLGSFLHYGSNREGQHPAWTVLGYPGPIQVAPAPPLPILPMQLQKPTELDCEVLVIGSGAGGGMAAGMLAAAGKEVILVEKGPYLQGAAISNLEAEMIRKSYDRQAAFQTADGGITLFAGSTLGGGTAINWTGSFPTPDYILDEWLTNHGLSFVGSGSFHHSLDQVWQQFHVNDQHSFHNPQNAALWRGSEKLGDKVEVIPRNVKGCAMEEGKGACGYCGMGCRGGNKRGTLETFIRQAAENGARILVNTEVQKLLHSSGELKGAIAFQKGADGQQIEVKIKAKLVILAAGSIHTPAILLRSGLQSPGLGENLFFHPTLGVSGLYDEQIESYKGVMMSAVNKQHMRLDGNYGFWIETPPLHPGVAAMALPWESPGQHKEDMRDTSRHATFIVLCRDKFGGKLKLDKSGRPLVKYKLSTYDRNHVFKGMRRAFELHQAAGAEKVFFPHFKRHVYDLRRSKKSASNWIDQLPSWGWKSNQFGLFTAHQMGTCAMGGDPKRHPVDLEGRFRQVKGLYIADGSLLPSAAGVNPMITIMTLAHHVLKALL